MFTYFTCIRPAKAVDGGKYIIRSFISFFIQGESLARGPKLLSIKNYVIEIMS